MRRQRSSSPSVAKSYSRGGRFVLRGGATEAEQLAARESIAHARTLDQKQQGLVNRLVSPEFNAQIVYRTQTATNGIAVLARPDQWEALANLPGVKSVAIIHAKVPRVSSSINYMGTRNFWDPLLLNGRGEGIGLAVIDTGLDFVHRSFGGSGDGSPTGTGTSSYVRNATTIGGGTPATNFPTAKVIWGWDVVGDAYNGGFRESSSDGSIAGPEPDGRQRSRHCLRQSCRRFWNDEREPHLYRTMGCDQPGHGRGDNESFARHCPSSGALWFASLRNRRRNLCVG